MGCAIVTTSVGARGLPPNTDAMVQLDILSDPAGTAEVIRDLLAAPQRRWALRERRALYQQHFIPLRFAWTVPSVSIERGMHSHGVACAGREVRGRSPVPARQLQLTWGTGCRQSTAQVSSLDRFTRAC